MNAAVIYARVLQARDKPMRASPYHTGTTDVTPKSVVPVQKKVSLIAFVSFSAH
jgi:hypothetical protein